MPPSTPTHQCPCGNIRLTVNDSDGSGRITAIPTGTNPDAQKVPLVSLRDASNNVHCLNCSTRVVSFSEGVGIIGSSRVAHIGACSPNAEHFSACFGIAILDPGLSVSENSEPSKPEGDTNLNTTALDDNRDNRHLVITDKHARRVGLRAHFEDWKQALLRDTERSILEAQAQCAWLCDRIQEAEGVCETSEEHVDLEEGVAKDALPEDDKLTLPARLAETRPPREPSPTLLLVSSASLPTPIPIQHSAPISKEPLPIFSSDSPIVGSLLSRRIGLAANASSFSSTSTPTVLLPVTVNPSGFVSASAGNISQGGGISAMSSGALPRKVHFKDASAPTGSGLAATTTSSDALTATLNVTAPATLNMPLVVEPTKPSTSVSVLPPKQVDKFGSKPLPSPAPPGGGVFKFVAKVEAEDDDDEGDDEEDDLFDMDGTVKDVARYGSSVEEETEEDDEEFDDAQEQQPVSLLSSSVPVSIMQNPNRLPSDRKKKKGDNADADAFMAPHEIVAQSYQQPGIEGGVGSVVGKPVVVGAASYKKSAL
ncbi:hypothetical protein BC830DRAFT_1167672 [Chytriomyces sp. MP71]|nr:hypothetical protein BC830DRAFT_1167672 [Chytriomyces sp. MP71]